jgi:hypothetical protein
MPVVEEHAIDGGMIYAIKPDHRDGTPVKSQWVIPIPDEIVTFRLTVQEIWFDGDRGWGLHLVNGKAENLGVAVDRAQRIFIARFEGDLSRNYWHGYPADHLRRTGDIPTEEITQVWVDRGYLPKPKVRKILKGQRCNL